VPAPRCPLSGQQATDGSASHLSYRRFCGAYPVDSREGHSEMDPPPRNVRLGRLSPRRRAWAEDRCACSRGVSHPSARLKSRWKSLSPAFPSRPLQGRRPKASLRHAPLPACAACQGCATPCSGALRRAAAARVHIQGRGSAGAGCYGRRGKKGLEVQVNPLLRHAGWHLMGTVRMGTHLGNSVVDAHGRCHDVKNLFISPFIQAALSPVVSSLRPMNIRNI
jgi:GMC oxidoreductase